VTMVRLADCTLGVRESRVPPLITVPSVHQNGLALRISTERFT
jgi:hypothetical protein